VKKSFGLLFVALGAALASCASIQQQAVVSTPVGQNLTAGVGDIVLRVEGRESMPNAFGRADLFGRRDRRAVARRRHYSIRRYHDEQHAANSPNSATNNDVGECWLNARCSDRHVDWNGLYPASGLYIN
jgi:hypothetical protein